MKHGKILLLFALLLLMGMLSFFAVQAHIHHSGAQLITTSPPPCDAILVLGAMVYPNGSPAPVLQDRLDNALLLYQNGTAPKLLLSGDHGSKDYDEVNAMCNYLLHQGVPRSDIFLDHGGFDTYDSIYRARDVFCVRSMVISTQQFHLPRALYIARNLGLTAYGYPAVDKEIYGMGRIRFRESLANVKAFLDVSVLHSKPKYLGEPIPITEDGTVTEG